MGEHPEDDFADYFRVHYPRLLAFVKRRVDDHETAQDICSESFLLAWKILGCECTDSASWLYVTARNLIGTEYRRRAQKDRLILEIGRIPRSSLDPCEPTDLEIAMEWLHPDDRAAIVLTYWLGLSAAEAAILCGCSEGAMWKRLSRARAQLRSLLSEA